MQHQLDVRERLEPRAEARLRLPDALRDRADPPAVARVEMQDPVGLGEAQRAEDDRLGLVRAAHRRSLGGAAACGSRGESWQRGQYHVPRPATADLLDRRAAAVARLAAAAVHLELVLHPARPAVGKRVVAERRALPCDPELERVADRAVERAAPRSARGSAPRAADGCGRARAPRPRRCSRRPASVRWSRIAALTGAFRLASRCAELARVNDASSGSGPTRASRYGSSSPGSSRSHVPNRRTSR